MTADLLHVGHLRTIRECQRHGEVIIGLLTEKALEGYKGTVIPYEERKELLEGFGVKVVPQDSLNCFENLMACKADYCASGDGFEPEELEAMRRANCKPLNIRLPGEGKGEKRHSSAEIKHALCRSAWPPIHR